MRRCKRVSVTLLLDTVRDHKEDIPHKISCRLINPSKSLNQTLESLAK